MMDDAGIELEGRWPDLPGDILSTIYRHCSSSYDRARFASVCTSWHAAASWQPKLQPLPLLLPSTGNGSFDKKALAYSPEDGKVLHARLPWFPYGKRIVGSYDGGWVAAAIGCRIDVINLFTCAWMLSKKEITCRCRSSYKFSIEKIIFSEDPAAKGCILAAMGSTGCITLMKVGAPQEWFYRRGQGWTTKTGGCCDYPRYLQDMVFCSGLLYGLSYRDGRLYKLAIGVNEYDVPVIIPLEEITIQRHNTSFDPHVRFNLGGNKLDVRNIFDLGGKLATAVEVRSVTSKARTFRVFELVKSDMIMADSSYKCMWAELTSLGDHALFLGPGWCCKAVHMPAASMRGNVERNCIYYTHEDQYTADRECLLARLDLGCCAVYCYESQGGVDHSWGGIMSRGYHYHHRDKDQPVTDSNSCAWIFPPQF